MRISESRTGRIFTCGVCGKNLETKKERKNCGHIRDDIGDTTPSGARNRTPQEIFAALKKPTGSVQHEPKEVGANGLIEPDVQPPIDASELKMVELEDDLPKGDALPPSLPSAEAPVTPGPAPAPEVPKEAAAADDGLIDAGPEHLRPEHGKDAIQAYAAGLGIKLNKSFSATNMIKNLEEELAKK